jgi:peptidoglycan/LPS O-acetylase OafA/YrhL
MSKEPNARFTSLESTRGLAAIVVAVNHVSWVNPLTASAFFQNGGLMVDLFFVLSGFVIFHGYGSQLTSPRSLGRFMWLRFWRLYPLHLAFLLIFLAIETARLIAEHAGVAVSEPAFSVNGPGAFAANLLLIHALGPEFTLTFNYPSWSISTEFYAYLLFGLCVLWLGAGWRLAVAAALIVCAAVAILVLTGNTYLPQVLVRLSFVRCALGFFLGVLTYRLYTRPRTAEWLRSPVLRKVWLPAALLAGLILLCTRAPGIWSYAMPPLSAALILGLVTAPEGAVARFLSSKYLVWLGTVSYSIYMTHAAIEWLVSTALVHVAGVARLPLGQGRESVMTAPLPGLALVFLYVALVLLVSGFTYSRIEAPFRSVSRSRAPAFKSFPVKSPAG